MLLVGIKARPGMRRDLRHGTLVAPLLLACLATSGCAGDSASGATANGSAGQGFVSTAKYPTDCPAGFVDALGSALRNTESASQVDPTTLGLGELGPRIACAARTRSTPVADLDWDRDSFYTVIVMNADVTESDVRYALEGLGFVKRMGWGREGAAPGEADGAVLMTYGEVSRNLSGNSPRWTPFRETFPPETVVLGATVRRSSSDPAPVGPGEPLPTAPETRPRWRCSYAPTYNEDWHDDVLCTNGVDVDRPYLRAWDSFVTEAEIMQSAREYEQQLNGQ